MLTEYRCDCGHCVFRVGAACTKKMNDWALGAGAEISEAEMEDRMDRPSTSTDPAT